jgi:hypothetical protein
VHIARLYPTEEQAPGARAALEALTSSGIRRGPVCTPHCERAKSQFCSRKCPYIPQTLTSDPVNHPLEPNIAALVFEIKKLGVFTPCWSCEGHNDGQNKLNKTPAVWFYASSVVHIRVLGDCIGDMCCEGRLSSPWQIRLCFSDPGVVFTTFSLEPALNGLEPTLPALHCDIARIAEELEGRMMNKAENLKLLNELSNAS